MPTYTGIAKKVDVGGNELTALEFYNGRVRADGFPDFTATLKDYSALLEATVTRFVDSVIRENPSVKKQQPIQAADPLKLKYSLENDGRFHLDGDIEGLSGQLKLRFDLFFDPADGSVLVQRPKGFDVEWQSYLLWAESLRRFVSMSKILSAN
jgi:hypothetical protein